MYNIRRSYFLILSFLSKICIKYTITYQPNHTTKVHLNKVERPKINLHWIQETWNSHHTEQPQEQRKKQFGLIHPTAWTYKQTSAKFLNLVSKHFPKNHRFNKIFNKNNIKVSYGRTDNLQTIIKKHNRKIPRDKQDTLHGKHL